MSDDNGLPKGWCNTQLFQVSRLINGDRGKNYPSGEAFVENGVPFVNAGHLCRGIIDFDEMNYITEERFNLLGSGKFLEGDILYCLRGSLGKAAIVKANEIGAIASSLVIIRCYDIADHKFLYYFLVGPFGELQVSLYDNGTAQPNLSAKNVNNFRFPLAPLPEQRRIVAKIEELFSDLDAGVAALNRAKANLKRYRAAVLKAAVEGRLTEEWRAKRPAKEPASALLARILKERRQKWEADQLAKLAAADKEPPKNWKDKYVEPTPPNVTGLPELPEGWCWASVDQICDVGTGTTPNRANANYYESGSIPWIMSGAVNLPFVDEASEFVTELALQETTLRLYPAGTLILALYGEGKTRGMVSELRIEATVNQALGALVFKDSAVLIQSFVKVFLTSNYVQLRRQAAGGMQPNLNLGIVKQISIPLPPLDEQTPIVSEVAARVSQIDVAETAIDLDLLRADRLRQSILKQAFEGKLVLQDPADEPASMLLERIRASRSVHEGNGNSVRPTRGRRAKSKQLRGSTDE